MGSKEIQIEFTEEQVERYNSNGFKLCFSCGMGENTVFNVIAKADFITSNVTITWNDEFKIAASRYRFDNGVLIQLSTDPMNIKFDQVYTLPPTWVNGNITDEGLLGNTFKMVNDTDRYVSAVVFKRINGEDRSFYISHTQMDSKESELLTPSPTVALWFQSLTENGVMASVNKKEVSIFDVSSQDKLNLKWNGSYFVFA